MSQKGLQRPFGWSLHYVAKSSRFWAAFYPFLQLLWLIHRALALVPRKVLKNDKNHVFATFALKIALFSLKSGAKAHTELQQGETSLTKQFPVKKGVFLKIFANHEPFERHFWSQGVHLHHVFSPRLDQIETRGLDH